MNNQDYIRRGVELAEGWEINDRAYGEGLYSVQSRTRWQVTKGMPDQEFLDALAAQLVRQLLEQGFDVHIDIQGSTFDAPGIWIEITDMVYSNSFRYEKDARENWSVNLIESIVEFDSRPSNT